MLWTSLFPKQETIPKKLNVKILNREISDFNIIRPWLSSYDAVQYREAVEPRCVFGKPLEVHLYQMSDTVDAIYFPVRISKFELICDNQRITSSTTVQNDSGNVVFNPPIPMCVTMADKISFRWTVSEKDALFEPLDDGWDSLLPVIIRTSFAPRIREAYLSRINDTPEGHSFGTIQIEGDPNAKFNINCESEKVFIARATDFDYSNYRKLKMKSVA
jgi:hypothetical protein